MTNKIESNPAMPPKNATHFGFKKGELTFYQIYNDGACEYRDYEWHPIGNLSKDDPLSLKHISEYALPAQAPATSHEKLLIDELTAASLAFKKQDCALMVSTSSDLVIVHYWDMMEKVKDDLKITVDLNQDDTIQELEKALKVVAGL